MSETPLKRVQMAAEPDLGLRKSRHKLPGLVRLMSARELTHQFTAHLVTLLEGFAHNALTDTRILTRPVGWNYWELVHFTTSRGITLL